MARPKDYRDLIVWRKAMDLVRLAHRNAACLPKSETYGLLGQMRRAAISVPSNIAEGHGRLADSQFRHFLGNARGSIYELRTQFELAGDFGYLGAGPLSEFMVASEEVMRLLNGLIASLSPSGQRSTRTSTANSASPASSAQQGTR